MRFICSTQFTRYILNFGYVLFIEIFILYVINETRAPYIPLNQNGWLVDRVPFSFGKINKEKVLASEHTHTHKLIFKMIQKVFLIQFSMCYIECLF